MVNKASCNTPAGSVGHDTLLNCIVILVFDTFTKMYHDTDTF